MANCDLCNKDLPTVDDQCYISNSTMREAAQKGFNPFNDSLFKIPNIGRMFGIADDSMYADWKAKVMSDPTDWILCTECWAAFAARGYLRK